MSHEQFVEGMMISELILPSKVFYKLASCTHQSFISLSIFIFFVFFFVFFKFLKFCLGASAAPPRPCCMPPPPRYPANDQQCKVIQTSFVYEIREFSVCLIENLSSINIYLYMLMLQLI